MSNFRSTEENGEGCDPGIRGFFTVAKRENKKGQSVAQHSELKGQSMAWSGKYGPAESYSFLDYILFQSPSEQGEKEEKRNSLFSLLEP